MISLPKHVFYQEKEGKVFVSLTNKLPPIPLLFISIFPMFSPAVWSSYHLSICLFTVIPFFFFFFCGSQDDGGKFWWGLVLSWSGYQLAPFATKLFKPTSITLHISVFSLSIMESTYQPHLGEWEQLVNVNWLPHHHLCPLMFILLYFFQALH